MSALESSGTSSVVDETWIAWYCSMSGNHVLCEADKPFIEDSFNLFGLKQFIPSDYNQAINTILDKEDPDEEESDEMLQTTSLLYGLIHARFIITNNGLQAMQRKYLQKEFGECPRTYCNGQAVLPIGLADEPNLGSYKLFCPRCRDIYNCPVSQRRIISHILSLPVLGPADIDGAFFGTSFPHIFLMTYENCVPSAPSASFVPRVFGFKVHASSSSLPKKVVVLDGASYSHGDASSDDLNFASSVESGQMAAAGEVMHGVARGNGVGNGRPQVVFDLTHDASGMRSSAAAQGLAPMPALSSNSGSTTLEARSNGAAPGQLRPHHAVETSMGSYDGTFAMQAGGYPEHSYLPSEGAMFDGFPAHAQYDTSAAAAREAGYNMLEAVGTEYWRQQATRDVSQSSDGVNIHHGDQAGDQEDRVLQLVDMAHQETVGAVGAVRTAEDADVAPREVAKRRRT